MLDPEKHRTVVASVVRLGAWERSSIGRVDIVISISIMVCQCSAKMCYVHVQCVLGAGAGASRRRAKPEDPAGEVSCAGG